MVVSQTEANGRRSGAFRWRYLVAWKLPHGLYEVGGLRRLVFISDHLRGMTKHRVANTLLDASTCRPSLEGVTPRVIR
jgi:hypothetical protein